MRKSKTTTEIIEEFIDTMEKVTGKGVTVDWDSEGNVTIVYEEYPSSILMGHNKIKTPEDNLDLDVLYRGHFNDSLYLTKINGINSGNEKLLDMSDYNPKKLRKN